MLEFETRRDAFGYLSESRRLAASLLWEIKVEQADDRWVVRVPRAVFQRDMTDVLDTFHGKVVEPG